MHSERRAELQTIEMQKLVVTGVDSLPNYHRFDGKYFANSYWPDEVKTHVEAEVVNQEYFRLLGLVGIVCAQYGYPSIDGQIRKHEAKNWPGSPAQARFLLDLGIHAARLAEQALTIKNYLFREFPEDSEARDGIWGLFFKDHKGVIELPWDIRQIAQYEYDASYRLTKRRPVLQPDRDLTRGLAAIEFTGDDAQRMSTAEFETQILPRVAEATRGWMDVEIVFSR